MVSILYTKFIDSSDPFCIARTPNTYSERGGGGVQRREGKKSCKPSMLDKYHYTTLP